MYFGDLHIRMSDGACMEISVLFMESLPCQPMSFEAFEAMPYSLFVKIYVNMQGMHK